MNMNLFLCESMLLQTKNRKLHEALSDVNQLTESKENELHNQPAILNSGSSAEGLGILGTDCDALIVDLNKIVAFNDDECLNHCLLADTRKSAPGFCHIVMKTNNLETKVINTDDVYSLDGICYLKRDRFVQALKESYPGFYTAKVTGPALKQYNVYDAVPALKCVGWPQESEDYFTRKRYWPKQKLLTQIHDMGIHVVGTSSAETEPQCIIEFRLSFSLAEKTLLRNLSDIQFATYWFLKSIKRSVEPENDEDDFVLKSYFLKVVLLRKCEETMPSHWAKENFLQNAQSCFRELHDDFKEGVLPHLFLSNCNLLAKLSPEKIIQGRKELENIVSNWDEVLQSAFFMDEFIDNQNPYSNAIMTRSMKKKIDAEVMDDHKSKFKIDLFPLCLEAETFSAFVFGGETYRGSHNINLILEANSIQDARLSQVVSPKYHNIVKALLLRRCVNILLRQRGRRSIYSCLELLEKAHYQETLFYPTSGFIDSVSSKVWMSYINYLGGNKLAALHIIKSIPNFDKLSPLGYIDIWINDYDKIMLRYDDQFLAGFLEKVLCFDDDAHKRSFKCNCIVLAHYLRSKTIEHISCVEEMEMMAISVTNVIKDLFDVWHDVEMVQFHFEIFSEILEDLGKKFDGNIMEINRKKINNIVQSMLSIVLVEDSGYDSQKVTNVSLIPIDSA